MGRQPCRIVGARDKRSGKAGWPKGHFSLPCCLPTPAGYSASPQRQRGGCEDAAAAIAAYLKAHPEIKQVFLHSIWARYPAGGPAYDATQEIAFISDPETRALSREENKNVFGRAVARTLAALQSPGRKIVIITSVPEARFDVPKTMARALILDRSLEFRPTMGEYAARQAFVNAVFAEYRDQYDLAFIRPHEEMCGSEYCGVLQDGMPIYFDDNHITQTCALKLSYLFDPIFQAMAHKQELPPRDAHN